MKRPNLTTWLVILVFLLICNFFSLWRGQKKNRESEKRLSDLSQQVKNLRIQGNWAKEPTPSLKKEEQEFLERYKEEVFRELESSIADIVPGKPILGGSWLLVNATFLTPDIILVHYEDGHILGQMIVRATKTEKGYSWELLANEFIE